MMFIIDQIYRNDHLLPFSSNIFIFSFEHFSSIIFFAINQSLYKQNIKNENILMTNKSTTIIFIITLAFLPFSSSQISNIIIVKDEFHKNEKSQTRKGQITAAAADRNVREKNSINVHIIHNILLISLNAKISTSSLIGNNLSNS